MQVIKKFLLIAVLFLSFSSLYSQTGNYQLSTHILDINRGEPAQDVDIVLYKLSSSAPDQWIQVATGKTDKNGRIPNFLPNAGNDDNEGTYMLKFYTEPYFRKQGLKSIYPFVEVIFRVEGNGHYHIPITMSANGYSTYRGN